MNNKIIKKAKPISEWSTYGEKGFMYENSNRHVSRLVIGTMINSDGTEQYLVENIYTDLIDLITSKTVKVHVDIYSEPMIVLEMNNKLVPHNLDVEYLKEDIIDVLKTQTSNISNQVRAACEIRNNAYSRNMQLGRATKTLRAILCEQLATTISYDFIKFCLKEIFFQSEVEDELEKEFMTYTKEDLISVYGGLIEKERTGAVRIEPMKALVEDGISVTEIDKVLKNEIARRFFEGNIS